MRKYQARALAVGLACLLALSGTTAFADTSQEIIIDFQDSVSSYMESSLPSGDKVIYQGTSDSLHIPLIEFTPIDGASSATSSATKAQTYRVTFYDWYGAVLKHVDVPAGQAVSALDSTPDIYGYIFRFWFDELGALSPYAFGTPVRSNINLLPHYEAVTEEESTLTEDDMNSLIMGILGNAPPQDASPAPSQAPTVMKATIGQPVTTVPDFLEFIQQYNGTTHAQRENTTDDSSPAATEVASNDAESDEVSALADEILYIDFDALEKTATHNPKGILELGPEDTSPPPEASPTPEATAAATATATPEAEKTLPAADDADANTSNTENTESVINQILQINDPPPTEAPSQTPEATQSPEITAEPTTAPTPTVAPTETPVASESDKMRSAIEEILSITTATPAATEAATPAPMPEATGIPEAAPSATATPDAAPTASADAAATDDAAPYVEVLYEYTGLLNVGTTVILTARVHRLSEDMITGYQWQNNASGSFEDVPGATGKNHVFSIKAPSEKNWEWRVNVFLEEP